MTNTLRPLINLVEAAQKDLTKFWFNTTTRTAIPVDNHVVAMSQHPETFGIPKDVMDARNAFWAGDLDEPPPGIEPDADEGDNEVFFMLERGWVRIESAVTYGTPYVTARSTKDAHAAVQWMAKQGLLIDKLLIYIMTSADYHAAIVTLVGDDLERFLRNPRSEPDLARL